MSGSRFKIGQTSKMLGIAPETLRYYEKKKILPTSAREDNNYRTFDVADVCILGKARTYLKYGFSLEEAQQMLNHSSIDYTVQKLEEQVVHMKERIQEELAVLHSMEAKLADIRKIQEGLGQFSIVNRPTMYGIKVFDRAQDVPYNEEKVLWLNHADTFSFLEIPREEFSSMQLANYCIYKGILVQDASAAGIQPSEHVVTIPSCPCLRTTTISSTNGEAFRDILAYMEENKLQVTGDVIWRGVAVHGMQGDYRYYRELYVPIL